MAGSVCSLMRVDLMVVGLFAVEGERATQEVEGILHRL